MKMWQKLRGWRFPRRVGLLRALLEVLLPGGLVLLALEMVAGQLNDIVLLQALVFLSASCGLWFAIRRRLPEADGAGGWKAFWREAGNAAALMFCTALVLPLAVLLQGWGVADTPFGWLPTMILIFLGSGPVYLGLRFLERLWWFWDGMRKRSLVWALTHAQLMVVFGIILVMVLVFLVATVNYANYSFPAEGGLVARMVTRFVATLFPFLSLATVTLTAVLFVLLPPALLISYLLVKQVTGGLQSLAQAATELRSGNYNARVPVQSGDEIGQLQADFNGMADDLQRVMGELEDQRDKVTVLLEAQRQLSAGVSHELRTPVATIQGYLEPLLARWDEIPASRRREDLSVIQAEVERLSRLIEDLFTLSQTEVDALSFDIRSFDLAPTVRRMVDTFGPLAWQRERVEVVAEVPPGLPEVRADERRLEQILANLLRNAIRYTPPGGIVAITARAEADQIRLEVCDTGEGIPPEELPRVWERFYRVRRDRSPDGDGAGLGLALVKELTEAMDGRVEAESILGGGSCFRVYLPAGA